MIIKIRSFYPLKTNCKGDLVLYNILNSNVHFVGNYPWSIRVETHNGRHGKSVSSNMHGGHLKMWSKIILKMTGKGIEKMLSRSYWQLRKRRNRSGKSFYLRGSCQTCRTWQTCRTVMAYLLFFYNCLWSVLHSYPNLGWLRYRSLWRTSI